MGLICLGFTVPVSLYKLKLFLLHPFIRLLCLQTIPSTGKKLSLVPVHTQTAVVQQCEGAPAVDLGQHLLHLPPKQIPDEGT